MRSRKIIQRARELRALHTPAEKRLWSALRRKRLSDLKFRRQHPIEPFIVDFACISKRFIIEVDGGCHDLTFHDDSTRQQFLESQGWQVFRVSNEDVLLNLDAVIAEIFHRLDLPPEIRSTGFQQSSSLIHRKRRR